MDLLTLYLIFILPNIQGVFIFLSIVTGVAILASFVFGAIEENERAKAWGSSMIKVIIPFVVVASLIPSSKQMMYIIGGYAATNVENIEKLPKNVVNAANKFLESYTQEEKKK